MLRPVGTEFFIEYPPSIWETSAHGTRMFYKVVAHVKVDKKYIPSGIGEAIKAVGSEEIDKREYNLLLAGRGTRYIKKTDPLPIIEIIDDRL